jgi:hypothetical protein
MFQTILFRFWWRFGEINWGLVNWILLIQNSDKCMAVANMVMKNLHTSFDFNAMEQNNLP